MSSRLFFDVTHFVIFHHKEVCFSLRGFQFIASEKGEMDGCAKFPPFRARGFRGIHSRFSQKSLMQMSWRANTKQNIVYSVRKILTKRKSETKKISSTLVAPKPWQWRRTNKRSRPYIIRASLNIVCWQPQCACHAIWSLNLHIYKAW